ncbi:DDE family transposase [Chitinophaga polysaccharea]|uniref:DDE family transposase n=2 Tax=Chitinophaga polysaccharea TaxID=1293035 RepID=A0A561P798_9BACT|nr:DDE family transposase [Chitinophaga polysaccharea]
MRQGRNYAPSVAAIDSQSIKKSAFVSIETGIDGGKNINGRKRHFAVDSLGLPIAISVSVADMHDSIGAFDLLWRIDKVSRSFAAICMLQEPVDDLSTASLYLDF